MVDGICFTVFFNSDLEFDLVVALLNTVRSITQVAFILSIIRFLVLQVTGC